MSENSLFNENAGAASESESARNQLFAKLKMFGQMGSLVANKGMVRTGRFVSPLMQGYIGAEGVSNESVDGSEVSEDSDQFSEQERELFKQFGKKLSFESLELATRAFPPVEGIQVYKAEKNEKGEYPAPHLGQLLSLGKAISAFAASDEVKPGIEAPKEDGGEFDKPISVPREPVLLMALNANEYGYLQSPQRPQTIRRAAMIEREMIVNQQSLQAPQSTDQITSRSMAMTQENTRVLKSGAGVEMMSTPKMNTANAPVSNANGAACCTGCGGMTPVTTASARYDKNGECMSIFCISCETKWRMRDCLKLGMCEFLSCVADRLCVDGQFQNPGSSGLGTLLGDCLGEALCTTLNCLPTAICGPRVEQECVAPPSLECNFAVEEKI